MFLVKLCEKLGITSKFNSAILAALVYRILEANSEYRLKDYNIDSVKNALFSEWCDTHMANILLIASQSYDEVEKELCRDIDFASLEEFNDIIFGYLDSPNILEEILNFARAESKGVINNMKLDSNN